MPPLPGESRRRLLSCIEALPASSPARPYLAHIESLTLLGTPASSSRRVEPLVESLFALERSEAFWAEFPLADVARSVSRLSHSPLDSWLRGAILAANEPAARACLLAGADPESRDSLGAGAVWLAAREGSAAALSLALDLAPRQAARPTALDPDEENAEIAHEGAYDETGWCPIGSLPLHAAARAASPERLALLLPISGDPDARCANSERPLLLAVSSPAPFGDRAECVRMLAEAGARLDFLPGDDLSPLGMAAKSSDEPMASLLLDLGASLKAPWIRSFGREPIPCEAIPSEALRPEFRSVWGSLVDSRQSIEALERSASPAPSRPKGPRL